MAERRRFPWGLTLVVIPALCLLIGLGIWQVQRLQWKQALISDAEVAASLARVTLITAMSDPDRLEFRKVTVDCPGLSTAPFIQVRSILEGEGGVRLWSLCRPVGFAFPWLVDRGFVADTVTARPVVVPSERMTGVEGEVRLLPPRSPLTPAPDGQTFYGPDALAMAKALGITINSFTSVSLEPRLVLWCLDENSERWSAFAAAERFAIHVLDADDRERADRFARGIWTLEPSDYVDRSGEAPRLEGVLARLECTTHARVPMGDHLILVGQVEAFEVEDGDALTYYRGRYGRTGA